MIGNYTINYLTPPLRAGHRPDPKHMPVQDLQRGMGPFTLRTCALTNTHRGMAHGAFLLCVVSNLRCVSSDTISELLASNPKINW